MQPKIKDFVRFHQKCKFDACTGCVNWIGGKTSGGGSGRIEYGSFWFDGRRWSAHRWSALFIHEMDIDGLDVDHVCRNPLCMHHLQSITPSENWRLRWERELIVPEPDILVPFYVEPEWYARISQYTG